MSPALNESTALQRFKHGNAVKIRNGIMFNFYPGLTHNYICTVVSRKRAHGRYTLYFGLRQGGGRVFVT